MANQSNLLTETPSELELTPEASSLLNEIKNYIDANRSTDGQVSHMRSSINMLINTGNENSLLSNDYKDTAYQDRYQDKAYDDHYNDNAAYRDGAR